MSFCAVDKLQFIRKRLEETTEYERMTEDEKANIRMAILQGLEDIEQKELEYKQMYNWR